MAPEASKLIKVAAGIVRRGDQILIARRIRGYLAAHWEFPGGKVEANETPGEALQRELREELDIEVEVTGIRDRRRTPSPHGELEVIFIEANYRHGELTLIDHDAIAWVDPSDLPDYRFAPADHHVAAALAREHATLASV